MSERRKSLTKPKTAARMIRAMVQRTRENQRKKRTKTIEIFPRVENLDTEWKWKLSSMATRIRNKKKAKRGAKGAASFLVLLFSRLDGSLMSMAADCLREEESVGVRKRGRGRQKEKERGRGGKSKGRERVNALSLLCAADGETKSERKGKKEREERESEREGRKKRQEVGGRCRTVCIISFPGSREKEQRRWRFSL